MSSDTYPTFISATGPMTFFGPPRSIPRGFDPETCPPYQLADAYGIAQHRALLAGGGRSETYWLRRAAKFSRIALDRGIVIRFGHGGCYDLTLEEAREIERQEREAWAAKSDNPNPTPLWLG